MDKQSAPNKIQPAAPVTVTNAVERFSGFAAVYDEFRPTPPDELAAALAQFTGPGKPEMVVDLGCGPGNSTRYWADKGGRVVGVDPSQDMLDQAIQAAKFANVEYRLAFAHQTGLPGACCEIITCSQSFHWMDPEATLAEVARLLKPGGVLAIYDHDSYPVLSDWRAEQAYRQFFDHLHKLDEMLGVTDRVKHWKKTGHLENLQASGLFRFIRQFDLHQVLMGNAHRLIGGAETYGLVQSLRKAGASEPEMGLDVLRAAAQEFLGDELRPWYWSTHVVVGVV